MSGRPLNIEFKLMCRVNDEIFDIHGSGTGDASRGTCQLDLRATPGFPADFDSLSSLFICCYPTASYFARPTIPTARFESIAGNEYAIDPRLRYLVHNSRGELVVEVSMSGKVSMTCGKLISENTMEGFSRVRHVERYVTPVREILSPSRPGEATSVMRFRMLSMDGEDFDGLAVAPYRWKSGWPLTSPLARDVVEVDVNWNHRRDVSARFRMTGWLMVEALVPDAYLAGQDVG